MGDKKPRVVRVQISAELLWHFRHEFSELLREVADAEADPRVARRLREIGACFEAGISRFNEVQLGDRDE